MRISDLEFYVVELPGNGGPRRVRSLLVRLAADTGIEGWGEACVAWRPAELLARRKGLLPLLAGRSVFDLEDLARLDALRPSALRAAVEMACWDLAGRAAGVAVCHLLGGMYRRRIPLAIRLASESPELVAQRARELVEQGFHTQIIDATGEVDVDRATVAAVREAVGDHVKLRLDGQARYEPDAALRLCSELDGANLGFCLDPLPADAWDALASLRRQANVPLAVGAAIAAPRDVFAAARGGAISAVVVELDRVGGLLAARKCATVAEAAALGSALANRATTGLAVAAMLHVAAATPNFDMANECGYHELREDILSRRLETIDGMMAVPDAPGLGVEVDRARLERYQLT